ncbi:Snm1p SKDI_04G6800 [Saccharomyces kudriavzevii IFO 1802]|uniref:SNM1-like protein n=1 Tax=Saccharomyces kudriavzevii (strain ATCC MYA-4449 / AS 2.2408 / CBS 8840 / NBRC 1802 / NCYC 2889) TaxID=226230 RepID=A0AA35JFP6_SACK1|nr:uncharacterized protein SKDI_04G6800 [Saccharomyces kudriavzevii IFO 1802]CAI4059432.1 hypothetical protein SKDI_04G6800 [Saccharomyces kudriavzevii IFO 1802]
MNKDQAEKYRERNLRHKYNILHVLPTLKSKALSGLYYKNFHNSVKRYQITLPEQLMNGKFCSHCGCVYVPNFNSMLQVTTGTEQNGVVELNVERAQAPEKCISVSCLNCKSSTLFDWKSELVEPVVERDVKFAADSAGNRNVSHIVDKAPRAKISSGKDRSKKRKSNSLTNLLSKRNQEKRLEKKRNSSLSLDSFMKS